jgi:hypothetical protein
MLQRGMSTIDAALHLSNEALIAEVAAAAGRERHATARLVALLAELDARRLYLEAGCASLFTYCTDVLHLSEHAAYGRIEAARASRRFPVLLEGLADGSLTLTAVTLLAPHLTDTNQRAVLAEARHLRKRAIEALVARLRPQPDVPMVVRKLPTPAAPPTLATAPIPAPVRPPLLSTDDHAVATPPVPTAAPRSTVVTPLAPERYKVQLTISRETHGKLRRAQDLLRHAIPTGDLATIVDRALTLLVADLERAKAAAVEHPRAAQSVATGSRHIPSAVRRAVWRRDQGRCAFVGTHGRCVERAFLEFHHVEPHAVGGPACVENIQLRCRAHNIHEAEQYFHTTLPLLGREAATPYSVRDRVRGSQSVMSSSVSSPATGRFTALPFHRARSGCSPGPVSSMI